VANPLQQAQNERHGASTMSAPRQYLTFALGDEMYGLDILHVQEIKGLVPITPIPNTAAAIRGVMNLRGMIVPVVDLRRHLGLAAVEPGPFTVIIVVAVGGKTVGLIVDAVSDVLDIGDEAVQPAPELGGVLEARCLAGIAQHGESLIALLDVGETLRGVVSAAPAVSAP